MKTVFQKSKAILLSDKGPVKGVLYLTREKLIFRPNSKKEIHEEFVLEVGDIKKVVYPLKQVWGFNRKDGIIFYTKDDRSYRFKIVAQTDWKDSLDSILRG